MLYIFCLWIYSKYILCICVYININIYIYRYIYIYAHLCIYLFNDMCRYNLYVCKCKVSRSEKVEELQQVLYETAVLCSPSCMSSALAGPKSQAHESAGSMPKVILVQVAPEVVTVHCDGSNGGKLSPPGACACSAWFESRSTQISEPRIPCTVLSTSSVCRRGPVPRSVLISP